MLKLVLYGSCIVLLWIQQFFTSTFRAVANDANRAVYLIGMDIWRVADRVIATLKKR